MVISKEAIGKYTPAIASPAAADSALNPDIPIVLACSESAEQRQLRRRSARLLHHGEIGRRP
ncbi:hypothetical protein BJD99_00370 [Rhodococcus sp. 1163]|nr:hypothetical protein BJD99_00370 [Rhodococcus sp. 1163]